MQPALRATSTRVDRAARGWGVALFATVTAGVSHGLAGGTFPGAFGIVASLVLAGAASSLLTAHRQSAWRLAVSVGLTQVMYHAVFSGMGDPAAPVHTDLHSHAHVAMLPEVLHTHGHSGSMWLAHVIAGVITLLVLLHAESALSSLSRSIGLVLARLLSFWRHATPLSLPRLRADGGRATLTPLLVVLSSMRYRGPPVAQPVA